MPDKPYDGHDRRVTATIPLADVVIAEQIATHRFRSERIKDVLCSVIAVLLISIPVSIFIGHQIGQNARENSKTNCTIQAGARPLGNGRAFVQRQILRVADRAFQQFPARFRAAEIAQMNRDLTHDRPMLGRDAPRSVSSFSDLIDLLGYLDLIDCDSVLQ